MLGIIVDFKNDLASTIEEVKKNVEPLKDSHFLFGAYAMNSWFINYLPTCLMK